MIRWVSALNYAITFHQAPDPTARERLISLLDGREKLSASQWVAEIGNVALLEEAAEFVFSFFMSMYNIDMARSRPADPFDDLELRKAMWSDWELDFAEAFKDQHGIDLFGSKAFLKCKTMGELVHTLAQELARVR